MNILQYNLVDSLHKNDRELTDIAHRVSTATRIARAADDPAGLVIAMRLRNQANGLEIGKRNLENGKSLLQTGDYGAKQASDLIARMRELALQADNGTLNAKDRSNLQQEVDALKEEYRHVTNSVSFNGNTLLNANKTLTVNQGSDRRTLTTTDIRSSDQGGSNSVLDLSIDVTTQANAQASLAKLDAAAEEVAKARSSYGSQLAAVDAETERLSVAQLQAEQARAAIEDADTARDLSELVKYKTLYETNVITVHNQYTNRTDVYQLLLR